MRLINAIKYDILFQFRQGFYYANLFISIIYIILLKLLPQSINTQATVLIVLTDPSVLGSFFIGAIFILERSQNTLQGLFVTPFRVSEYILSKVISLTFISLLSSLLIALLGSHVSVNLFLFFIGVILTSIFFTLLGFIFSIYAKTVNQYFLYSMLTIVFIIPIISYLNLFNSNLFYLFPFKATILLIDGAFTDLSFVNFAYASIYLSLSCVLIYHYLISLFMKKVIKGGE